MLSPDSLVSVRIRLTRIFDPKETRKTESIQHCGIAKNFGMLVTLLLKGGTYRKELPIGYAQPNTRLPKKARRWCTLRTNKAGATSVPIFFTCLPQRSKARRLRRKGGERGNRHIVAADCRCARSMIRHRSRVQRGDCCWRRRAVHRPLPSLVVEAELRCQEQSLFRSAFRVRGSARLLRGSRDASSGATRVGLKWRRGLCSAREAAIGG